MNKTAYIRTILALNDINPEYAPTVEAMLRRSTFNRNGASEGDGFRGLTINKEVRAEIIAEANIAPSRLERITRELNKARLIVKHTLYMWEFSELFAPVNKNWQDIDDINLNISFKADLAPSVSVRFER